MNLRNKKMLASKVLNAGKKRITFVESRLADIKEAITKQDIRDLHVDGAIQLKEVSGRKKNLKRGKKRSTGNIRKKVNKRKQDYVIMTRKLRKFTSEMKKLGRVTVEEATDIRKKIRNKAFRSKAHLKEYIGRLTR